MMEKVLEIPSWASLNGSLPRKPGMPPRRGCPCGAWGWRPAQRAVRLSAVRCSARILSVHHVGGDGENGGGGDTAAVGVVALDIAHEGVHQVCCQLVHPVVIISIF